MVEITFNAIVNVVGPQGSIQEPTKGSNDVLRAWS